VSEYYPGWVTRIYHNIKNKAMVANLTAIERDADGALDLCYVGDLPGFGDMLGTDHEIIKKSTILQH
jgi:hypothetical protein